MAGINSFAPAAREAVFGGTNHSDTGRKGGIEVISDSLETARAEIVF
ncbi:hypothetical protein [Agrobacterium sp. NPDC089420]